MARNGAGTYNLPIGNPVTTGTTISSTWANSTLTDIATALTGSISSDGQTPVSSNLPMSGYAHTGVANATIRTMYASAGQVQDGALTNLTLVSGTDVITATGAVGMGAYATGQTFTFTAAATNTGAVTLNINSIGAKAITKNGATALSAGDITSGAVVQVVYDGTQFQLVSSSLTVRSFSAGTTGLTPSTATNGNVTLAGTLNVANGGTGVTTSTGTGSTVLSSSPTLVTPDLGTPSAVVLTNATGTANSLNAGIGVNQTWSDVTASRALNTTYTNSTGKPIFVMISAFNSQSANILLITVSGVLISAVGQATWDNSTQASFIVPNGATYSAASSSGVRLWAELR